MRNKFIILFLVLLLFLGFFLQPTETFERGQYDCIISINVHEKFPFLLKQIKNISENVKCKYAIILNCNEHMFTECKNNELPENVFVYPEPLEKNTFHGSLLHGIYRNMQYALENFQFEYFIITSSRSMFDNDMKLEDLQKVSQKPQKHKRPYMDEEYGGWWWPIFKGTQLMNYYKEQNLAVHDSPHEGLLFTHGGCVKIVDFLEAHNDIKGDLFNHGSCVEEFAIQSIAINEGDNFYYIGNGCCSEEPINHLGPGNDLFKFMYKTKREVAMSGKTYIRCNRDL
jgi:hypothetical protein